MPRTEEVYRILLASPSDLADERSAAADAVDEINKTRSNFLLELLTWETHAPPGVGEDAQDVVNRGIGDDYDIFLGVLWTTIGSPTLRSESGTVEEFERAMQRYRADPSSIKVLFYFKDAPISPSRIQPEQLARVTAFRERLEEEGVLYREFQDAAQFSQLLRMHIPQQIAELRETVGIDEPRPVASIKDKGVPQEDEEEGFLDLVENMEDSFQRSTEATQKLEIETRELGEKIGRRTEELQSVPKKHGKPIIRVIRRIGDRAAEDLETYSNRAENLMSDLIGSYEHGLDCAMRAVEMAAEANPTEAENIRGAARSADELAETVREGVNSLGEFRRSVASTPRLTTKLNRARKKTVHVLDSMIAQFERIATMSAEAARAFRDKLPPEEGGMLAPI